MAQSTSRSATSITDHNEIRRWAESEGGQPARVAKTGRGARTGGDTGIIRIDFPGFSGGKSLEHISWDEWFDAFDENNLALLIGNNPKKPRFNKLVSRESAQRQQSRTGTSRTRSRKSARKKQSRSSRTRSSSSSRNRRASGKSGHGTKRKARSTTARKRRSTTRT